MKTTIPYTINVRGRLIDLSQPQIMGILNCTPDSFYAGSRVQTEREIALRAHEIAEQQGDIADIGAFSTRPGAAVINGQEEMERLRLRCRLCVVSVPTSFSVSILFVPMWLGCVSRNGGSISSTMWLWA